MTTNRPAKRRESEGSPLRTPADVKARGRDGGKQRRKRWNSDPHWLWPDLPEDGRLTLSMWEEW